MIDPIYRKLIRRVVLLLALLGCFYFLREPQPAFALTTCQQNCDNRASTCETNCEHSGGNVKICFEGCQAALSACLTICNKK